MKTKKIWAIISVIVFVLQLAVEAVATAVIIRMDLLPDKLLGIFLAALAVLLLLTGGLMFLLFWMFISSICVIVFIGTAIMKAIKRILLK